MFHTKCTYKARSFNSFPTEEWEIWCSSFRLPCWCRSLSSDAFCRLLSSLLPLRPPSERMRFFLGFWTMLIFQKWIDTYLLSQHLSYKGFRWLAVHTHMEKVSAHRASLTPRTAPSTRCTCQSRGGTVAAGHVTSLSRTKSNRSWVGFAVSKS